MKCIQNKVTETISRVSDAEAWSKCKGDLASHRYVPKALWKAKVRNKA